MPRTLALRHTNRASEGPEERSEQWYWCGVLGEMYGGSTETRFTKDVELRATRVDRSGVTSSRPTLHGEMEHWSS